MKTLNSVRMRAIVALLAPAGLIALALWWLDGPAVPSGALHLPEVVANSPVPKPHTAAETPVRSLHAREVLVGTFALQVQATLPTSKAGPDGALTVRALVDLDFDPARPVDRAGDSGLLGRVREVEVTGAPVLERAFWGDAHRIATAPLPFALEVEATGRVLATRFHRDMAPGLRNTLTTALFGVTVSGEPAEAHAAWTSLESDGSGGNRHVSFAREPGGALTKRWESGTAQSTPGGPVGQGTSTLAFDAHGLFRADYQYRLEVNLGLGPVAGVTHGVEGSVTFTRAPSPAEAWAAGVRLADLVPDVAPPATPPSTTPAPLSTTLEGYLKLAHEAHVALQFNQRVTVVRSFGAWLAGEDGRVTALVARLMANTVDEDGLRTLVEGLIAADTPASREAHAAAVANPATPYPVRFSLLTAVTLHPSPSPALVAALWTHVDTPGGDFRLPATLALAAQARVQPSRDAALGAAVDSGLMSRATPVLNPPPGTPASPDDEVQLWLRALGNRGGKDAWPLIAPHVTAAHADTRMFALEALRFVPMPEARVALAKALLLEPYARNRRAAAETALYHPQQVLQAPLLKALKDDVHGSVRIGAAHTLATWAVTTPALRTELLAAVDRERIPQVKSILAGLAHEHMPSTAAEVAP